MRIFYRLLLILPFALATFVILPSADALAGVTVKINRGSQTMRVYVGWCIAAHLGYLNRPAGLHDNRRVPIGQHAWNACGIHANTIGHQCRIRFSSTVDMPSMEHMRQSALAGAHLTAASVWRLAMRGDCSRWLAGTAEALRVSTSGSRILRFSKPVYQSGKVLSPG